MLLSNNEPVIISNSPCVLGLCSRWWGPGWWAPLNPPVSGILPQAFWPVFGSHGRAEACWDTPAGRLPGWGSRCAEWCCGNWRERPWRWPRRGPDRTGRTLGPSGRSGRRQSTPSGLHHPECMLRRKDSMIKKNQCKIYIQKDWNCTTESWTLRYSADDLPLAAKHRVTPLNQLTLV